ncbi:hypothetical protein D3C73_1476800 [compost metagenome]
MWVKYLHLVELQRIELTGKNLQCKAVARNHMSVLARPRQPGKFKMADPYIGLMAHRVDQLRQ